MNEEFILALKQLESEKGIREDVILEALETALISSYKKNYGTSQTVDVSIDRDTGEISVSAEKIVVDEVLDDQMEISLDDAKKINPRLEIGDVYYEAIDPEKFGRIAAQTARQVVIQRIKDAEREVIYDDYADRENEIITCDVQRVSKGNVFVDLGKTEAILPVSEQTPGESYAQGDRYKMLILEVNRQPKGPQIVLSRSHPNLVRRLFELEVPEIHDGVVEIYSVAREAGSRTKLAVFSKDEEVDPLGACVGFKGSRVKTIVDELHDEKIDIVIYEKDIATFIGNALSPSKVVEVFINHREKAAMVVVPDYQLSLAIGKEGQNARLAAKLTNWKIDIKSETQFSEYLDEIDQTIDEFRDEFENTAVQDDEIEDEEAPAEEVKEYDNFASIGGLTGMDLNNLFVDASSETTDDETEASDDVEEDDVPDYLTDDE
ncbi:transcription termination factor NusA [Aedoeadaptatus nemausensis]|uniref:Transcription termination/antitermination protein NusA n=1 Tax=Aedoeadaptatus nemausensis TaxID=2582829 RepID=A0A6V6Y075_9FIRM|nr:transcription termination factor NusA [Peptoniphilus nemausensis]CAC9924836.1 transcription termination factor NusA [Peptoniphilus nemausensis]